LTLTEIYEGILKELAEVKVIKEKFMHMELYIADERALTDSANLACSILEVPTNSLFHR